MKSTKNTANKNSSGKSKNGKTTCSCGKGGCCGRASQKETDSESEADPFGSYTGNPNGFGKYEQPVQDADDL